MKHCFMVMVHNQPKLLEKLFSQIDYEQNSIIVHVDKKAKIKDFSCAFESVKNAKLIVLKKRQKVYWGSDSQIKTEYLLFEEAIKHDFDYCHLISGQDLLIKPFTELDQMLSNAGGRQFFNIEYNYNEEGKTGRYIYIHARVRYHYLIHTSKKFTFWARVHNWVLKWILKTQNFFKVDRNKKNKIPLAQGNNWFTGTKEMLEYILQRKKINLKLYKHTHCADEVYKAVDYCNSPFYNKEDNSGLVYVNWPIKGSSPLDITMSEYEKIINSKYFFARKFNLNTDGQVVEKVLEYTRNK